MKIVKLYEIITTDGYSDRGSGRYFPSMKEAKTAGKFGIGGWVSEPKEHSGIESEDGGFFILKSSTPIYLEGSLEDLERKKKKALSKLTKEERKLLGLD